MMIVDRGPLIEALTHKKQVTLNYTKKTTGEAVVHTGGIYEIGVSKAGEPCLWLWDTISNDSIRCFLFDYINSFQVLDLDFAPPQPWPLKLDGQIIG